MLSLQYLGHACFKLFWNEGSVVFDPYEPGKIPGLDMPEDVKADKVICSHGHFDHSYEKGVACTGKEPDCIITRIESFHDDKGGALRGENLITAVEAEGIKIVHMGDIGHSLSKEQLLELENTDILMIPVGGVYTVDAAAAKGICDAVKPAAVVPMHYRRGEKGLGNIGEIFDFLGLFPKEKVYIADKNTADVQEIIQHGVYVFDY